MIDERISPGEIASTEKLRAIEKRYRRSRQKIWFILGIPVLWLAGAGVAKVINELWAWEALVGWCLLVAFLMGVFLLYQVPATSDVVHEYSQEILPGLFRSVGVENIRVARRHDLSMKVFLEAGLYYDKYSAISREDCIQGRINGCDFGMYEIAMQVGSTVISAQAGTTASLRTNHFYGWFIVINSSMTSGFHFITLRKRINEGESDDWHKKTLSHWEKDTVLQKVSTGRADFNNLFLLTSDHPEILLRLLTPSVREALILLADTATNSFAISIHRSSIFFMIGHETADLRKCPQDNFTTSIDPGLLDDVKWYAEAVKRLQKISLR